ncbi:MAG: PAS domain-containing protein, partial [Myxococcota bacterium]
SKKTVKKGNGSATIAVNRHGDITYVAGRTSRFLQPHPGELSNNLFDHVRRGLRRDIRAALDESVRCFRKVERHGVSTEIEGQMHTVKVTVRPLPSAPPHGALFAVILEETGEVESPPTSVVSSAPDSVVEELETELHSVRAELQCTIEELESANEELRATNEELVSTNEEMQSANEEMQTSREELQSANEELETLNADLEDKAAALASANDYLQNLLAATQIATIFLDRQLRVTKFTPAARSVFRLIEADVGRFLEDLAPKIEGADLLAECRRVLSAGQPVEAQVHTPDGDRWYAVRLLPYRKDDGSIDGVVSTFIDITELKTTEASLRSKEADASRRVEEFDAIFDAMSFPIIVFDAEGHPVRANRLTRALFGIDDEFTDVTRRDQLRQDIGLRTVDGTPLDADERPSARALRGEEVRDVLLRVEDPRRGDRVVEATAIPLRSNDLITGAVLGWRDITEKMAAERALREHQRLLQDIIDESPTHIFIKDTAGRFITINKALERLIGASREQVRGKTEADLRHCGHADSYREQLEAVVTSGRADQR